MSDRSAAGPAGYPYQDLHIYYIEGCLDDTSEDAGASYIGNWVEDGYSFLFFSEPAMDIVERMISMQPGLVLVDCYQMGYEEWLGEKFKRFTVGNLLIVPPWDPSPDDRSMKRIVLDPGVVFGTGTHPTTRDCLELIEKVCGEASICTAADVGTGTGLLALAAAHAGCRRVLAFDLNFLAVKTARRNIVQNGLEDTILAFQGNAEDMSDIPADLMIANIHYDVMVRLLASKVLLSKHWLILSGLLRSQAAEVLRLLAVYPIEILEKREQNGIWHTFLAKVHL